MGSGKSAAGGLPYGTLVCNTLFACLALLLNLLSLRQKVWQRSVLLQAFSGSFCGAASAFAGHSSDTRELWKSAGPARALLNSAANLCFALIAFTLALHLERLLAEAQRLD